MGKMNRIIKIFSKGAAFIYIWIKYKRKKTERIKNNQILVIMPGHLGDALLLAPAMCDIKKYYEAQGKQVFFLCYNMGKHIFKYIPEMRNATYIGADNAYTSNRDGAVFFAIKHLINDITHYKFEKIITLNGEDNIICQYLVATLVANESWVAAFNKDYEGSFFRTYFDRSYTHRVKVDRLIFEAERMKILLSKLGIQHKTRIQGLSVLNKNIEEKSYISIAIDSQNPNRRWPSDRFISLINRLLSHYDYDIYIAGDSVSYELLERYSKAFTGCKRVKNYIGKTNLEEWMQLIKGAICHIGVDSGSIHVAASVGTQAFCLAGVWNGKVFFPYEVDDVPMDTCVPICIYCDAIKANQMECFGCVASTRKYGKGNASCYKECKKGNPNLCLQNITVDNVYSKVDEYFKQKKSR